MKKYLWIVLGIALACSIALAGCSFFSYEFYSTEEGYVGDPTKGAAKIEVNGGSIPNARTISPDMDVANYSLYFTNPTLGEGFGVIVGAGGPDSYTLSHTQSGLAPDGTQDGDWHVTVSALNANQDVIGAIGGNTNNTADFEITAGENTTVSVTVIPIVEGDNLGDLRVYVSWPDAAGANEALTGTLDGDLIIDGDLGSPSLDDATILEVDDTSTHTPGYYELQLHLWDGALHLWGYMEALRIVDNLPTDTGDKFVLTLSATGGVVLSGSANMNNPVQIELDADSGLAGIQAPPTELDKSDTGSVTVTAVTTPADPGTWNYQWYRDGLEISGADGTSITINAEDETLGIHNYAILVDTGTSLSSENFVMEIVE